MTSKEPINGDADADAGDERAAERDLVALEPFGATLRSSALWESPPEDLPARITAAIATERANASSTLKSAAPAEPTPTDLIVEHRGRPRWLRPALALAAAAVLAFTAGVLVARDRDDGGGVDEGAIADVALSATGAAPGAEASGRVYDRGAGFSIHLEVNGLPPAPDGTYYEGWLADEDGQVWVSVGTFHMRGDERRVVLWSGVPSDRFPRMVVTSQTEGAGAGGDRGEIVLDGQIIAR
jgi:hypothetical protein